MKHQGFLISTLAQKYSPLSVTCQPSATELPIFLQNKGGQLQDLFGPFHLAQTLLTRLYLLTLLVSRLSLERAFFFGLQS